MKKKREQLAYQEFKKAITKPKDRIDRIENLLASGIPDISACFDGVDFWAELKAPIEPKRHSTPLFGSNHPLTQEQMNWFLRQANAGGTAWIIIRTDKRWMLINGRYADYVNKMTVWELSLIAQYHAETGESNWPKFRKLLLSKPRRLATS